MGLSTKKTKTTTNQNTTANVTPTNLPGIDTQVSGLAGRIGDTFKTLDPYSLVAGADPLQTQAATGAANLTTNPNYQRSTDILNGVAGAGPQNVQGVNIADYIKQFQNPYTEDVVNTSLAKYDQGAGQQQASADLAQAQDSTFGGSGGSILQSDLKSKLALDRGGLAAGLYSNGFDRASSLATTQAANDLQTRLANANFGETALARQGAAAGGLADVAGAQGADSRANIDTQSRIGDILRQIAAAKAGAPIATLGAESSLLNGLPLDLFKGQNATGSLSGTSTTKQSGASLTDFLSFLAANAQAAAAGAGG